MSYFASHSGELSFPKIAADLPGFRPALSAAVQPIGADFFSSNKRAITSMPTGVGKTTVIKVAPFVTEAQRVLVLTPSRLVREQLVANSEVLLALKNITALPTDLPTPSVMSIPICRDEESE